MEPIEPIKPLPGQLTFTEIDPEQPQTKSVWRLAAWQAGKDAALDGRSLDDMPDPNRKTHRREFRRLWRDGFESITLFPLKPRKNE